ncbi:hypothetical protein AJ79_01974 [Helicocarpus griseus UAMH5409]|uniref:amidase n=1 Tax=Helicocarpus griseus UAMH5409 TaxID=1447875 RepID=A0A2B7Y3Z0_9EURO|nr:hypothetical protein AJ79_01974 [Helicocarpus griseus UAMH5409]
MARSAIIWDSLPTALEKHKVNLIELDIIRRCGVLSERELEMTEKYNVATLLDQLARGQLTAVEVTGAFSKRAAVAGQLTNCLTETLFDEAHKRARELDVLRKKGQLAGPLQGLPVSIKDCFQIVGSQATLGLTEYIGLTATENSSLVDMLLKLGAVLYVKTNVPQVLMSADSENVIFGRTLNPWNTAITAGGSSGGEGTLIALHGSPLGVGTDIGGSIRIPSLCCGLYGFKPTTNRIPYSKQQSCHKLLGSILPSAGPLANDLESLRIFCKSIIDAHPANYDSMALDVPWRDSVAAPLKPKLRFGLLPEDPMSPLHPPVKATLAEATRLLRAQGHEVVPLSAEECQIAQAHEVLWRTLGLDNTANEIVARGGEPIINSRVVVQKNVEEIPAGFVKGFDALLPFEKLYTMRVRREEVMEAWREIWTGHGLDAVIAPGAQSTAVKHDTYGGFVPYTGLLNLLDYPACMIPFGRAALFPPFEKREGQWMTRYDPELVEGAPCSIQVFTSRMRDEECLAIAKTVDECLRGK